MLLKWKRDEYGGYKSDAVCWDSEAGKHRQLYTIRRMVNKLWRLSIRGGEGQFFITLREAKHYAQEVENAKPSMLTDFDRAMGAGGKWREVYNVRIAAQRTGREPMRGAAMRGGAEAK